MFKLLSFAVVSVVGLTLTPTTVSAAVLNGSFETGDFSNWITTGQTTVEDFNFGVTPADAGYQAVLETLQDTTTVSGSDLESFLGLSNGSLTTDGVIEGSAIKQTIVASSGDILSFSWNFLTDQVPPDSTFNDFAFFSLGNTVSSLADTFTPTTISFSRLALETGYQTYSYTIPVAGTYTLGFGVVDAGDSAVNSALVIDNVKLQAVDESMSSTGVAAAMALGVWLQTKARKRSHKRQK
ncbi:peptidase domain-containing protein [Nostoc sp. NIES-4103]|nr:peptidase domain-containing protein [Nostoc sp. NIES-4103]